MSASGPQSALPKGFADLLAPVNIVVGHYGVGKTNFSLNLALDAARDGFQVTLVDLDVVNPYFRSTEYRAVLEESGVKVVAPVFAEAGTSLDVPSLTGAVAPAIQDAYRMCAEGAADNASAHSIVIVDAGGDDAGATALGRFSRFVSSGDYRMWYVVNAFRNLIQDVDEACGILHEIERGSHLVASGVVSNAHLKGDTSRDTVERGARFAQSVARELELPLVCVTAPKFIVHQMNGLFGDFDATESDTLYPVDTYVRAPWE